MIERNKSLGKITTIADAVAKVLLILVMAFPFFWMISTALQTLKETLSVPLTLWPEKLQWVNFSEVFKTIAVGTYLKNSIIVCVSVVIIQYLIIVPCAYSLAKYDYKGKPLVFGLVMLGQMIPMQLTFLPVYFMFGKLGLINTYASLILPFISNPFGIFMLRQYFMQVPTEIIEAARLDNASDIKIMFKIMMPMVKYWRSLPQYGLFRFLLWKVMRNSISLLHQVWGKYWMLTHRLFLQNWAKKIIISLSNRKLTNQWQTRCDSSVRTIKSAV